MITVKIIADSMNSTGNRLTSWELEYPLFIHAEFMTHRDFSRNAASARAIPFETYRDNVFKNPAWPVKWGSHQKGMQVGDELLNQNKLGAIRYWINAMDESIGYANDCNEVGLHKSLTNRLLAPWAHIKIVATITDMGNFFALRAHKDAEPTFQLLAYKMLQEYLRSTPTLVSDNYWHMPYADLMPDGLSTEEKLKVATARACWVSYNSPAKTEFNFDDAFKRHDDSITAGHWSPFEHCAQAVPRGEYYRHSNFDSPDNDSYWSQYRQTFLGQRKKRNIAALQEMFDERPEWIAVWLQP